MKLFYDFSIWAMSGALQLAKGGESKLARLVKGRKGVLEELQGFRSKSTGGLAWFHVASLGEYEQAKPVVKSFKLANPDILVLVTFFSPSGYENVIKKPQANVDYICYLPFDTRANASRFLDIVKPSVAFFVKYDLWANYIFEAKKRHVPLFLFSASMRREQVYFQSFGGFFRKVLKCFDYIYSQNQETLQLLREIGIEKVDVTGDTRYDNVKAISENPKRFPELDNFVSGKPTIVVGSAWQEDMDLIIPFVNKYARYKFIIAPHDIKAEQIEGWQKQIKSKSVKYSEIDGQAGEAEVLFIDNIGMLSSLYQFAKVAYVGGAFGKGLHNILEPLAFQIPVLFGKLRKTSKFPEAEVSKRYGCGFEVGDAEEFEERLLLLELPDEYENAAKSAQKLVAENLGSADKIIEGVQKNIQWK